MGDEVPSQAPTPPPQSYLRRRASACSKTFLHGRYILSLLAVIVIIIMAIGVVFAAHAYYIQFGGQGFLKVRGEQPEDGLPKVYLPLRKIEQYGEGSLLPYLPWNKRSPQVDIPYYTCGDQQNSCEAYSQPDICCPVGMACYKATYTPSKIFCCNSTVSEYACQTSNINPPTCMESLVECSAETGGGCCPSESQCSPNGCIFINSASTITASPTTSFSQSSSVTQNKVSITGTPITITSTVTIAPQATVTIAKEGEIAYASSTAGRSLVTSLYLPYSFACALVGTAILMVML